MTLTHHCRSVCNNKKWRTWGSWTHPFKCIIDYFVNTLGKIVNSVPGLAAKYPRHRQAHFVFLSNFIIGLHHNSRYTPSPLHTKKIRISIIGSENIIQYWQAMNTSFVNAFSCFLTKLPYQAHEASLSLSSASYRCPPPSEVTLIDRNQHILTQHHWLKVTILPALSVCIVILFVGSLIFGRIHNE